MGIEPDRLCGFFLAGGTCTCTSDASSVDNARRPTREIPMPGGKTLLLGRSGPRRLRAGKPHDVAGHDETRVAPPRAAAAAARAPKPAATLLMVRWCFVVSCTGRDRLNTSFRNAVLRYTPGEWVLSD